MIGKKADIGNLIRSLAVISIVVHHWLLFIPHKSPVWAIEQSAELIETVAGTAIHLFFILSGFGLALSYFLSPSFSWAKWAKRRVTRILFPYLILVGATFGVVNFMHAVYPQVFKTSFSWATLAAYLTFTRNFYSAGWAFNPTFWYMPVIVGLYILFPLLIWVFKAAGPTLFFLATGVTTYLSISICVGIGYPIEHQTALPFFFVIEFAVGIYIGWRSSKNNEYLMGLVRNRNFLAGILLYFLSWLLIHIWTLGDIYNDLLTALGIFFIVLYPCGMALKLRGPRFEGVVEKISDRSYYIYLIHGPFILFLFIPIFHKFGILPLNSLLSICLAPVYFVFVMTVAGVIASPIESFSKLLMRFAFREGPAGVSYRAY